MWLQKKHNVLARRLAVKIVLYQEFLYATACDNMDKNYQQQQHIKLRNVQYIYRISCQKQKSFSSYITAATKCRSTSVHTRTPLRP